MGKKILVVEDDADIRETLVLSLDVLGYDADAAANGEEGLRYLSSHPPPALILLDLMMPVLDGWTFRDRQKSNPAWSGIPVVVITADGHAGQKAEQIGAIGGLKKPFELELLKEIVGSALL